jgi:hypothetical protein
MTTQQNSPIGYGDDTSEELHAIVQRAHRERAQAMREFFMWLFARRKATTEEPRHRAHGDGVTCS